MCTTGVMGTAILMGILSAQAASGNVDGAHLLPTRFRACVRRPESADVIRSKLPAGVLESGIVTMYVNDNRAAVQQADMVLLACQPHLYKQVLANMAGAMRGKLIMSVLAGVTWEDLWTCVYGPQNSRQWDNPPTVIRVMPNIASAVQASSTVIEVREVDERRINANKTHAATARAVFECVGTVFTTPPETFAICTTLNGSAPAFLAMVIDGLVDGAVALGLSRREATRMAAATMRGTAELILAGKATHDVRYEVACPGGATIQGLRALEEARTRAVWMDAMRAATSEQSALGEGLKVQRRSA